MRTSRRRRCHTRPTRPSKREEGGQKEMDVPMDMNHVSDSEPEEEDWEDDVDEVRRGVVCYKLRDDGTLREGLQKDKRR